MGRASLPGDPAAGPPFSRTGMRCTTERYGAAGAPLGPRAPAGQGIPIIPQNSVLHPAVVSPCRCCRSRVCRRGMPAPSGRKPRPTRCPLRAIPLGGCSLRRTWTRRAARRREGGAGGWVVRAEASPAGSQRQALGRHGPRRIATGAALGPVASAPARGLTPCRICTRTGAHPRWPHLHRDSAHPCPRLRRDRGSPPVATSGNALPLFATLQAVARTRVSIRIHAERRSAPSSFAAPRGEPRVSRRNLCMVCLFVSR